MSGGPAHTLLTAYGELGSNQVAVSLGVFTPPKKTELIFWISERFIVYLSCYISTCVQGALTKYHKSNALKHKGTVSQFCRPKLWCTQGHTASETCRVQKCCLLSASSVCQQSGGVLLFVDTSASCLLPVGLWPLLVRTVVMWN